jgi:hypothetical protein
MYALSLAGVEMVRVLFVPPSSQRTNVASSPLGVSCVAGAVSVRSMLITPVAVCGASVGWPSMRIWPPPKFVSTVKLLVSG